MAYFDFGFRHSRATILELDKNGRVVFLTPDKNDVALNGRRAFESRLSQVVKQLSKVVAIAFHIRWQFVMDRHDKVEAVSLGLFLQYLQGPCCW